MVEQLRYTSKVGGSNPATFTESDKMNGISFAFVALHVWRWVR
jgi:hypothetical protein